MSFFLLFVVTNVAYAADWYVSTTGTPTAGGTQESPWDISTALNHPSVVKPGDTIWVKGGIYTAPSFSPKIVGTESSPIILRAMPGERVTFDTRTPAGQGPNPNFTNASNHWWWGVEVTNSNTTDKGEGLQLKSHKSNKIINSVFHDLGGGGFGNGDDIYGSIFYNNGNYFDGQQHHFYTQNPNQSKNPDGTLYCLLDPNGDPSIIEDSIVFQSFAFGMHAYSGGSGCLTNIHMIGSVWFTNGQAQQNGDRKDDILVGGAKNDYFNRMIDNMTWALMPWDRTVALGRYSTHTCDFDVVNNYIAGNIQLLNLWDDPAHCKDASGNPYSVSTITGNTFGTVTTGTDNPLPSSGNTILNTKPTVNKIFVRPNKYEDDRGHIVVYNWENKDTVSVDVSTILEPGDQYEVRNGQNFYAPAVLSGTYNGEQLALPMSAGFNPAQPVSPGLIAETEKTGKAFNVFVIVPLYSASPSPTNINKPGDANNDNVVDGRDYVTWLNNYNKTVTSGASVGDFNTDGIVDGKDYVVWLNNYNPQTLPTSSPSSSPSATPISTSTATATPSSAQQVNSLTLINAVTDQDIMTLSNGSTISFAAIGTTSLNVRANTTPSTVGSVKFGLDTNSSYRIESDAPYALAGDTSGNYNGWTPSVGSHTITATPYTSAGAGGVAGTPLTITFTVTN